MIIEVSLSLALLFGLPGCEDGCKVLVGKDTPMGTFRAVPMTYQAFGFLESGEDGIYAIHPVWNQERQNRLGSDSRRFITSGCINVDHEIFKMFPRTSFQLIIRE